MRRRERADGALGGVVADLQGAVIEIARERRPAGAGITDRLGSSLRPEIIASDASRKVARSSIRGRAAL